MSGGVISSTAGKSWFDECSINRDTERGNNMMSVRDKLTMLLLFSCQWSHLGPRDLMGASHWTLP